MDEKPTAQLQDPDATERATVALQRNLAIVAGIVALAFAVTCRFPFVDWDDMDLVVNNTLLKLDWASIRRLWTAPTYDLYTPLAYTLWAAVADFGDKQPWAFHALNVLLHAGTSAVAFALLRKRLWSSRAAMLGALLFGLHPLQVEPVAWVSGMNGVLAGLLSLSALLALPPAGEGTPESKARYAVASLLFALALFSKPTAVVVPLMAMALGIPWRRLLPWIVMAGIFAVIAAKAQPAGDVAPVPAMRRPIVALDAVGFYAVKAVFPVPLGVDYGRRPEIVAYSGIHEPYFYVGAGILVAACLARGEARRGLLLFLVPLLPVLGLRPFAFQEVSTVADRYAYLSMFGAAYLAALMARHSQAWRGTVIAMVPAAALITFFSLAPWRDTASLFKHALQVNPQSYKAPYVLGYIARQQGLAEEAERNYRLSLDHRDDANTHYNLGYLYYTQAKFEEAIAEFDAAAASKVPRVRCFALFQRGMTWLVADDAPRAAADFRASIDAYRDFVPPYLNLARLLEATRPDAARRLCEQALEIEPGNDRARRMLDRLSAPPQTQP